MKPVSIYQVFPRDFGPHGNLNDITEQLSHIREMGFDYVYLLPIHPIGIEGRKGTLGSPYAIRNYDAVDPAYGTMEDFMNLIERAHACGLKVMMDIVIQSVRFRTGRISMTSIIPARDCGENCWPC